MSINWRDNKRAVVAYERHKQEVIREIEHDINEELMGDSQCVNYHWHSEYFFELENLTKGAEFCLAVRDMKKDIQDYLEELGYTVESRHTMGGCMWTIDWGETHE